VIVASRRKKAILGCLFNSAFNGISIGGSGAELDIELYVSKALEKKRFSRIRIGLKDTISSELCSRANGM
jgi:hypothetical protein